MLVVISPAKTLDYKTAMPNHVPTDYEFEQESQQLINNLKEKSPEDIKKLMKLSDNLAELNHERYADWQLPFSEDKSRASVFAFKGDVYQGLDAYSLSEEDIKFAQDHLRILSGLYGVLKPLDKMLPYRLEMGTRLENSAGKDLYSFWGTKISEKLKEHMPASEDRFLVNLASNEYFKAVKKDVVDFEIITPQFFDEKNGKFKIISFYAKKARGLMSQWIIKSKITRKEDLTKFDLEGYYYDEERSSEKEPVFLRKEIVK
ncbi:MAG: peroxide stress protein YaaA [Lentisphaerales bacterium]|nr:peroxide stress protein YaaA [Lentisphaerales bacterium]